MGGSAGARVQRRFVQPRRLSRRRIAVIPVLMMLPLGIAACEKMVTHEPGSVYTSELETSAASYDYPASGGPAAYQGTGKAKAAFAGSASPTSHKAYGEIDAENIDFDGTYGAAFYFPVGTFTGSSPGQTGSLDIMRWQDGSNHGGIRIGADHTAHLVNQSGDDVESEKQFTLREGCWNWIVVHQNLSASDSPGQPLNEVFLNGQRIVSSTKANTASSVTGVDSVRFGLVEIGSGQTGPVSFYVDDAYISTESAPRPPATGAALCKPLPNVLFIVTDDHRPATEDLVMPNTLKWFRDGDGGAIKGGTQFKRGFATTPLCCPARSSIFSGRYAHNHGVIRNALAHPDPTVSPPRPGLDQDLTLQHYLNDAGYQNAIYGKFLMEFVTWNADDNGSDCPCIDSPEPVKHFDDYRIYEGGYNGPKVREKRLGGDYFGPIQPPAPTYTTSYVRYNGTSFIEAQHESEPGRPWFLYLAPFAPHESGQRDGLTAWADMTVGSSYGFPIYSPPALVAPENQFESDRSDKPDWVRNWSDDNREGLTRRIFEKTEGTTRYPGLREQQLRTLRDVDDLVEDVFQRLVATGEADNTLAAFLGDNGYMWREHGPPVAAGSFPQECRSESGLNDGKMTGPLQPCGPSSKGKPYLESAGIPFLLRWPDSPQVFPGVNSHRLVANIDLAPTVLDATGQSNRVPASTPMDGKSLLGSGLDRDELLLEAWGRVTRTPTWASLLTSDPFTQYIGYYSSDTETFPSVWEELYDGADAMTQLENRYADGHSGGAGEPPAPNIQPLRSCVGSQCP